VRFRQLAPILCTAGIGALLGWAAWGEGRAPALAAMLLICVGLCETRLQAFALGMFYTLALMRHVPEFIAGWFENNAVIGVGAVLTYSLIAGGVWCTGWTATKVPWKKSLAVFRGWALALLPPAAIAVPGHPLIAWGSITPGAGWIGVALSVGLSAAFVWVVAARKIDRRFVVMAMAIVAAILGFIGWTAFGEKPQAPSGVVGMTTYWGGIKSPEDVIERISLMGKESRAAPLRDDKSVVIWPESILGTFDHAFQSVLNIEVLKPTKRVGVTQVIGMDLDQYGRSVVVARAFYPDGGVQTARSRQPAPLSLWRPWMSKGTFDADWTGNNTLKLAGGKTAAVIFCYEEYIPALYLINEIKDDVEMYVAMANTWAEPATEGSFIQTQHSQGMAKLFARSYVKAENRPAAVVGAGH